MEPFRIVYGTPVFCGTHFGKHCLAQSTWWVMELQRLAQSGKIIPFEAKFA